MLIGNGLDMFGVIAGGNHGNPREPRRDASQSNAEALELLKCNR